MESYRVYREVTMKNKVLALFLVFSMVTAFVGCSYPLTTREGGAIVGGLVGAGSGAAIGSATGHAAAGAAVGGPLGLIVGFLIGDSLSRGY